jgi:membrane protease YdiL (CAAX protease family)
MNAMQSTLRGFASAVIILWASLGIAAYFYSQLHNIPAAIVRMVLPALLLEAALYLAAATPAVRKHVEKLSPWTIAMLLTLSAIAPYLLYTACGGPFQPRAMLALTGLAAVAASWYVVLPHTLPADLLFMLFMASIYIAKVFNWIYPEPAPHVTLSILGTSMWIRTGIISVLSIRRMSGIGFGLLPSRRDWYIGILHYLVFLPAGFLLALALRFVKPHVVLDLRTAGIAVLTFFGTLWVLAAMEEVFFRGLLQQSLSRKLKSSVAGLIAASLIFGAAHLNFRNAFPNWRMALLAAVAGLFYGHAYQRASTVRASMVTHAFVVTTWIVFLGKS